MRYAKLKLNDVANAPGIAVSFYTQGCPHHCPGCFNPETWDFNGGMDVAVEDLVDDILKRKHIDGITLSGGDPFFQQRECVALLSLLPDNLDVWIYTGFSYEQIMHTQLAKMADYIVDGKFEKDKIVTGQMYGSSNQRIIKINKIKKRKRRKEEYYDK